MEWQAPLSDGSPQVLWNGNQSTQYQHHASNNQKVGWNILPLSKLVWTFSGSYGTTVTPIETPPKQTYIIKWMIHSMNLEWAPYDISSCQLVHYRPQLIHL